jgi:DNA-binding MarR family transcriptional regulator
MRTSIASSHTSYGEAAEKVARPSLSPLSGEAPERVTLGMLGDSVVFSLRKAQLALQRRGLRSLSGGQIGPAEYGVLVLCAANPGIAQVQVAATLDVDKASVVALVDRLEGLGWLIRRRSQTDRRRHGLHLTGDGARSLQQLEQQAGAVEAQARDRFTPAEWTQFLEFLGRVGQR